MNKGIYEGINGSTYNVQPLADNMMGAFNPMVAPSVLAATTAFFGKKVAETQEGNVPINTNAAVSYKSIPYDHGIDFPSLYDPSTNRTLATPSQGMTIHNPQDEPPVRQSPQPPPPQKTQLPLGTTEQNFIKLFKPHENNARGFIEKIRIAIAIAVATNDAEKLRNKIDKVKDDASQAVLLYENQVPEAVKRLPPHTSIFPSNKREVAEWKESNYALVNDALTEAKEVANHIETINAEVEAEANRLAMKKFTLKKVAENMEVDPLVQTAENMGVAVKEGIPGFRTDRAAEAIRTDIINKLDESNDIDSEIPKFAFLDFSSYVEEQVGLLEKEVEGDAKQESGDLAGALAMYQEAMDGLDWQSPKLEVKLNAVKERIAAEEKAAAEAAAAADEKAGWDDDGTHTKAPRKKNKKNTKKKKKK